jgi:carboxymethylenebutenolidase
MTNTIKLLSQLDEFEFSALHSTPAGRRRGGVIVIQEVFGLDKHVQADVARWAALGFEVIAPSMFDRQQRGFVAAHDQAGFELGLKYMSDNGEDNPVADVQACIDVLKDQGPVYIVGYCYGGTVAWRAASRARGLAAAASYYGSGVAASADLSLSCPVICHFGRKDPYISVDESVASIKRAHPKIDVFVYDNSGHGFNNEGPDADPADVKLARERTLAFFAQHP